MSGDLINETLLMKHLRAEVSECCLKWILSSTMRADQQFSLQKTCNFEIEIPQPLCIKVKTSLYFFIG